MSCAICPVSSPAKWPVPKRPKSFAGHDNLHYSDNITPYRVKLVVCHRVSAVALRLGDRVRHLAFREVAHAPD